MAAPRTLRDPGLRHAHARVVHATSTDLARWSAPRQVISPAAGPAWDDRAIWTGSTVATRDGWRTFVTGSSHGEGGLVQRIGWHDAHDLAGPWRRSAHRPIAPDPALGYETLDPSRWHDQAWRDPWVVERADDADHGCAGGVAGGRAGAAGGGGGVAGGRSGAAGDGSSDGVHHLLATARLADAPPDDAGVLGHVVVHDDGSHEVRPPRSAAGAGFGHLEVPGVHLVDGRWVLVFSCEAGSLAGTRRGGPGGIFATPAPGPLGPFDVARATRLPWEDRYAGRLVRDAAGAWWCSGFVGDGGGSFSGVLADPVPVTSDPDTGLVLR